jgi:hypothetical protein
VGKLSGERVVLVQSPLLELLGLARLLGNSPEHP